MCLKDAEGGENPILLTPLPSYCLLTRWGVDGDKSSVVCAVLILNFPAEGARRQVAGPAHESTWSECGGFAENTQNTQAMR